MPQRHSERLFEISSSRSSTGGFREARIQELCAGEILSNLLEQPHSKGRGRKDETNHIVMQLLSTDNPAYMAWLQSCDQNYPYVGTSSYEAWTGTVPALHYAVLLGLSGVVELLLDAGAEVNAQGDIHGNALQVASHTGQEQIVQILLDKGADVNARSRRGKSTALEAASMQGHEQIVRMLLKKGADVNTPAGIYGDALHAAVAGGRERVVRILSDTNGGV
jgi:hypothetical protein